MNVTDDAARMLEEVRAAKAVLAKRAVAPVWYHPALGLLMGGLVATLNQPIRVILAYEIIAGLGTWLLVQAYKRRTGLWVSGYRKGRTRWVAFGLATLCVLIALASLWLGRTHDLTWGPYVGGALVFIVATLGGFVWEAAFRRDLRDESGL